MNLDFSKPEPKFTPRIILVDDDPVFGMAMTAVAEREKIPFIYFSSLKDAYQRLPDLNYEIAIIDFNLGRVTGVQLARFIESFIEKNHKNTVILMVSSLGKIDSKNFPKAVKGSLKKANGPVKIFFEALKAYRDSLLEKTHAEPEPSGLRR